MNIPNDADTMYRMASKMDQLLAFGLMLIILMIGFFIFERYQAYKRDYEEKQRKRREEWYASKNRLRVRKKPEPDNDTSGVDYES
jgi:hypothetical protein